MNNQIIQNDMPVTGLLDNLRQLIVTARQQALRAVDVVQVQTCWEMGRHIVEFEQGGSGRAEYGARLLSSLAKALTLEFGKGFDVSNLRYMRLFYQAFPIRDALRHELSWTHYRLLLRVENEKAREWYMQEDLRFKSQFCYIDAYTEPYIHEPYNVELFGPKEEYLERLRNTPTHLVRLRFLGNMEAWSVAFFKYSDMKYEPCLFDNGEWTGTLEQTFDIGAVYLEG
jgi:hypothetical protein